MKANAFASQVVCGLPERLPEGFDAQWDPSRRVLVVNGISARYVGLPEALLAEIASTRFELASHRLVPPTPGGGPLLEVEARR